MDWLEGLRALDDNRIRSSSSVQRKPISPCDFWQSWAGMRDCAVHLAREMRSSGRADPKDVLGFKRKAAQNINGRGPAMSHTTHYHTLISRGRKAGLNTRELYSAMASLPVEAGGHAFGESDSNGYVSSLTQQGNRVYRPVEGEARA